MIAVIDYGAGNLFSVKNALDFLGVENCIAKDAETIQKADGMILPGVGAFPDAMEKLKEKNMVSVLCEEATKSLFLESVWVCSYYLKAAVNLEKPEGWD